MENTSGNGMTVADAQEARRLWLDYRNKSEEEFIVEHFVPNGLALDPGVKELMVEHTANMLQLLSILSQRETKYRGLWKMDGWEGNLALARHKFLRVMRRFWKSDLAEGQRVTNTEQDDIYDLINYLMFTATLQREGRRDGVGF